jgi:hypothetical protein
MQDKSQKKKMEKWTRSKAPLQRSLRNQKGSRKGAVVVTGQRRFRDAAAPGWR